MIRQQKMDVWPGNVPGSTNAKQAPVFDLKTEPGVIRIIEVTNPTLEVYKPKDKGNGVAVIVCPGGGYEKLAYVLVYRIPNQREGALQDIQRAIRLVRQNNKQLQKIGIVGFSAGGSLSARAATRFNETTYPKIDAADELSCRPDFAMLIYPAYLDEGANHSLTPELTITEQTPPMFLFATGDDYYGNSVLVMAQSLRQHKIPVELHFMATGGHGYGMRIAPAGLQWPVWAKKWLKEVIKK